jgi:hypothetical protein
VRQFCLRNFTSKKTTARQGFLFPDALLRDPEEFDGANSPRIAEALSITTGKV